MRRLAMSRAAGEREERWLPSSSLFLVCFSFYSRVSFSRFLGSVSREAIAVSTLRKQAEILEDLPTTVSVPHTAPTCPYTCLHTPTPAKHLICQVVTHRAVHAASPPLSIIWTAWSKGMEGLTRPLEPKENLGGDRQGAPGSLWGRRQVLLSECSHDC